jgi:hypothetical protein
MVPGCGASEREFRSQNRAMAKVTRTRGTVNANYTVAKNIFRAGRRPQTILSPR